MRYGLSESTLTKIQSVFASFSQVEKAILYGSRAKGNYKPASDIDLTLYGASLTTSLCGDIAESLDDLLLPYTIDLSVFEELEHAKLREHIERVGVVFYERAEKKADWEIKKLGDVCEIVNGGTPKTNVPNYWFGQHLWITPAEMGKLKSPYISDTERKITDAGLKNSSASLLPKYSIILSSRAPIGHLVINTNSMATNQGCKGLIPSNKLSYKYLYYYLFSKVDLLNSLGTGTTFKELSGGKLKEVAFPLAPLHEQKRIVEILDEVFAGIAKAKENAERNLQNAREIFENVRTEIFQALENNLDKVPLSFVCNEIFAGGDAPKDNLSDKRTEEFPIPVIANAVKDNGLYGFTNISRVNEPSITIAARGSGTGHTEVRLDPFFPIVRLIVLTPNLEKISLLFLKYAIQNLVISSNGSAIPQLTVPMIKEYYISLPPLPEQQAIVKKLDSLAAQTKQLEAIYQKKLTSLEELKKSVLQKAFAGELYTVTDKERASA